MGEEGEADAQYYAMVKTSVWWDIENCAVPKSCDPNAVAKNMTSALANNNYRGPVSISAYGDTHRIPASVQHALSSTGVSLHHVPAGVKDASHKKILLSMLLWAVENPPPANYLLISGDRDFSDALHQLRMRSYNILLAQPQKASAPLVAAAKTAWLWTSLVAGGPPLIIGAESEQSANNGQSSISDSQQIPVSDAIQIQQPDANRHLGTGKSTSTTKANNGSKRKSKATQRNWTQNDESKTSTMPILNAAEVGGPSVKLRCEELASDCHTSPPDGLRVPLPDSIQVQSPVDSSSVNIHMGNDKSPFTGNGSRKRTRRKRKAARRALNQTTGSKTSSMSIFTHEDQSGFISEPFSGNQDISDYWNIFETSSSFNDPSNSIGQPHSGDPRHGSEIKAPDSVSLKDWQDESLLQKMLSASHDTLKHRYSDFPESSPSSSMSGKSAVRNSTMPPESIRQRSSKSCSCHKHSQDVDLAMAIMVILLLVAVGLIYSQY